MKTDRLQYCFPCCLRAVEKTAIKLNRSGASDAANIKDFQMKRRVSLLTCVAATCVVFAAPAFAKSCEEVKAEIAAKLDAKGVVGYTMEAVPMEQPDERK